MAKNKVSEWDTSASNNTDIAGINIAEGCAPSGINNAIREVMAQIKDMQTGADSDGLVVGGAFTSSGGAVFSSGTTFSGAVVMSSTVTMNGTNNIGNTTSSTILSGTVTQTSASKLYLDSAVTTASAPPLSWSGDTNTGIYRPAADTLSLVTSGTDRLRINSSGIVIIGTGEATTSVTGNILRSPSGSGTNISGSNLEIQAGNGTGTGGSGLIILKTSAASTTSSSTANTITQRLAITKNGGFSFGSTSSAYGSSGQVLISNGDAPPSFDSSVNYVVDTPVSFGSFTDPKFNDFIVPSWVKKIIIGYQGISTSATANIFIQLIVNGTLLTTGYGSSSFRYNTGSAVNSTAGFIMDQANDASDVKSGTITLINLGSGVFVGGGTSLVASIGGISAFSGQVTGVTSSVSGIRFTTQAGTANFTAGKVNVLYQ
jgi:hypothetical protein